MSTTTECVYVRGTTAKRLRRAILDTMRARGLAFHGERQQGNPFTESPPPRPPQAREVSILRHGRWFAIQSAALDEVDLWGKALSTSLERSVLAVWTWDGEAVLVASRWKGGVVRLKLQLPRERHRDGKGALRAPARVLRPWLAPASRAKVLREGILLRDAIPGAEDDQDEFVSEEESLDALLDAVGAPRQQPFYMPGATRLTFVRSRTSAST